MRYCFLVMCTLLAAWTSLLPAGCASKRPGRAEVFVHDAVREASQTLLVARDATRLESQALREVSRDTSPGGVAELSPEAAYERARRGLRRAESRAHATERQIRTARVAGVRLSDAWNREIAEYSVGAYRDDARARLDVLEAHHEAAVKALEQTAESARAVRRVLADRVMNLKHRRSVPALQPPEPADDDSPVLASMADCLVRSDEQVDEFLAVAGRPPSRPPPEQGAP